MKFVTALECEINIIETPTSGFWLCTSDEDCQQDADLQSLLSGVSDWSQEKVHSVTKLNLHQAVPLLTYKFGLFLHFKPSTSY